ncbi:MAG: AI-2E family transporter [Draconibacterium sp.]|nr:AI-2E family transporter [Draconibacterium sp.]
MSNLKLGNNNGAKSIEAYVKTAMVFLVIYASFMIFKPFLLPVVWGIIIAIALFPMHKRLTKILRNKGGLSATIITLVILVLIIVPSFSFTSSLVDSVQKISNEMMEGTFVASPPPEEVAEWPVIGEKVYTAWLSFSENVTTGIIKYQDQLLKIGEKFISIISGFAGSILLFIIAIIIAGVFLANSSGGYKLVNIFFTALIGDKGDEIVENSRATISSVVTGILGTAIIQTVIIATAFFVFNVPGAAILTIIVLFFAIAQIPAVIIVLPVIIFMLGQLSGGAAVIFVIWTFIGAISDNFLKPMLLGRGMKIPMVIILIGSIGGMMIMGIIGLFIGAVVFALAYQLFQMWLENAQEEIEKK